MPIYPMACMRDRTEPLDEPERTDADWMEDCKHCAACERLCQKFIRSLDDFDRDGDALLKTRRALGELIRQLR